jgi:hypothetical protein
MNKLHKTIPLLLVAFSLIAICYAEGAGLGVSDYEAHPQIRIGEDSPPFQIARISNEGTLNLTITPTFTPYYNETTAELQIIFTPNSSFLQPQDSIIFYGKVVSATKKGTFQGMVEFKTHVHLPADYQGNPSTPGGSAKITVTILEPSPPAPLFVLPPLTLLLPLILIPSVSVSISVFAYRRHKHHGKLPSVKTKEKVKPKPTEKPKKHEVDKDMETFANLGTKQEDS